MFWWEWCSNKKTRGILPFYKRLSKIYSLPYMLTISSYAYNFILRAYTLSLNAYTLSLYAYISSLWYFVFMILCLYDSLSFWYFGFMIVIIMRWLESLEFKWSSPRQKCQFSSKNWFEESSSGTTGKDWLESILGKTFIVKIRQSMLRILPFFTIFVFFLVSYSLWKLKKIVNQYKNKLRFLFQIFMMIHQPMLE